MNKKDTIKYESTVLVSPGETVLEILIERGITQAELAKRLNRPLKTVNGIIKGKVAITPETALQLEQVLGISANFWNNLESQFQELKLRLDCQKQYEELIPTSKIYPYTEMVNNGWLEATNNLTKRVEYLLNYFGVTNFENIIEEAKLQGAFRITSKKQFSMPAIISWLRKGSIDGERIFTEPFDNKKIEAIIPKLREMTLIENPNELMKCLQEEFKICGIAFVVTKNLKNAPICGATRWISPEKALIQMSIRLKWVDIFWFSLFHELGHIVMDNKKNFNVDFVKNKIDDSREKEIDIFASDSLIPSEKYKELEQKINNLKNISDVYPVIKLFSKEIGVHPGIVVGRLQHEKKIPVNMNMLRMRYSWI